MFFVLLIFLLIVTPPLAFSSIPFCHWNYTPVPGLDPTIQQQPSLYSNFTNPYPHPGTRQHSAMASLSSSNSYFSFLFGGYTITDPSIYFADFWQFFVGGEMMGVWKFLGSSDGAQMIPTIGGRLNLSSSGFLPPFPGSRLAHCLVGLGDGKRIRLFGGEGYWVNGGIPNWGSATNLQDIWDFEVTEEGQNGEIKGYWTFRDIAPGSAFFQDVDDMISGDHLYPASRYFAALWPVGDDVILFGGVGHFERAYTWRFSDVSGEWSIVATEGVELSGASHWQNEDQTLLYAFSGEDLSACLHVFDVVAAVWTSDCYDASSHPVTDPSLLKPLHPGGRKFGTSVRVGSLAILFAGFGFPRDGSVMRQLSEMWLYDMDVDMWVAVNTTHDGREIWDDSGSFGSDPYPRGRLGAAGVALDDKIVLFSGHSDEVDVMDVWVATIPSTLYCEDGCHDRGRCYSPDGGCTCFGGFGGLTCEDWYCRNGRLLVTEDACNHGSCSLAGSCICDHGWVGSDGDECNEWNCGFEAVECSGHGTCNRESGSCSCTLGWDGRNCTSLIPGPAAYLHWILLGTLGVSVVLLTVIGVLSVVLLCVCRKGGCQRESDDNQLSEALLLEKDRARLAINSSVFQIRYSDLSIESKIASGGSNSHVFLASWENQEVAYKCFVLIDSLGESERFREFETEVELLASFSHPVRPDLSLFTHDFQHFGATLDPPRVGIVCEYCSNGNMRVYIESVDCPMPIRLKLLNETAQGMRFLHHKNVLHRDLKPENVLVSREVQARICDFGISRFIDDVMQPHTRALGTSDYMAPEILTESYTFPVDVFSYGILLFVCLSGNFKPYGHRIHPEMRVATDPSFRPKVSDVDWPPGMEWCVRLMVKCWSHDPAERPTFDAIAEVFSKTNEGD